MATQVEETQAKEFLKRAEIRTMKKDLLALREVDALKERDKIAKIKTLEEQLDERKKANESATTKAAEEKAGMEEVLGKNEGQERIAEKDLKNYATEQERQEIFLLESQRLGFEKQVDTIDKEKDPALKLKKNNLLLQKRDWQEKLNAILEKEKKLEEEQKFIAEKAQTTTISSEKKGLESRRWDLDKEIQEVEKKRWASEKQIQEVDADIGQIDKSSDELVVEKNDLRNKVLGVDKQLREIYSVVMAREEEKRRGQAAEQITKRETLEKLRADKNEKVQRQQWSGTAVKNKIKDEGYLSKAPKPVREKILNSSKGEEEQRTVFLHDVENWSQDKDRESGNQQQPPAIPMPPAPHR